MLQSMSLTKSRWSKVYESSEEELINLLHNRNITTERVVGDEFSDSTISGAAESGKIWCAEGSFTAVLGDQAVSMQPGDLLQFPAGAVIGIRAGISGFVYYLAV